MGWKEAFPTASEVLDEFLRAITFCEALYAIILYFFTNYSNANSRSRCLFL